MKNPTPSMLSQAAGTPRLRRRRNVNPFARAIKRMTEEEAADLWRKGNVTMNEALAAAGIDPVKNGRQKYRPCDGAAYAAWCWHNLDEDGAQREVPLAARAVRKDQAWRKTRRSAAFMTPRILSEVKAATLMGRYKERMIARATPVVPEAVEA